MWNAKSRRRPPKNKRNPLNDNQTQNKQTQNFTHNAALTKAYKHRKAKRRIANELDISQAGAPKRQQSKTNKRQSQISTQTINTTHAPQQTNSITTCIATIICNAKNKPL